MRKTKKILVTGAVGFIGSHLTEKLLYEGYQVVGLDNFNSYYNPEIKHCNIRNFINNKNFKLITGDIRDTGLLEKIFSEHTFYKVIHLAAQPGVRLSVTHPQLYIDINISGTLNMLNICRDNHVRGLIFASSSSIYGSSDIPVKEEGVYNPLSPYGVSKKTGELLCYTYNKLYKLPIVILRFFTVYGPRQRPDMAIYKFAESISKGKEITLYGDGSTKRDYTYISNIVEGIYSSLRLHNKFEIINLGNAKPTKLNKVITLLEKNLKKKALMKHLPEQAGDPTSTNADIRKARKLLNYHPTVSIENGIKSFIEWYKNEKS